MKQIIVPLFLLFSIPLFGQEYLRIGIFDNSVKGQYPSTLGFALELGAYSDYDWFKLFYGLRVEKGHFGPEDEINADYISFNLVPKFYVDDFQEEIKLIAGAGFRFGAGVDKKSRATYLQSWWSANVGIGFGNVELLFSFERSLRNAIYRIDGSHDIGYLSLIFRL